MDGLSLEKLTRLFRLASKFCEEAAELVKNHARREQILRREPISQDNEAKTQIGTERSKHAKIEEGVKNQRQEGGTKEEVKKFASEEILADEPKALLNQKKESSAKPKRPSKRKDKTQSMSGYRVYLVEMIKVLKTKPEYKDYQIGDFSTLVSGMWKGLLSTEKEIWTEKARETVLPYEITPKEPKKVEDINTKLPSKREPAQIAEILDSPSNSEHKKRYKT